MAASTNKQISSKKEEVINLMDKLAPQRTVWFKKNRYYYNDLIRFFKHNIPDNSSVLEVGCGTGEVLASLNPGRGVGIDISEEMVKIAKEKFSRLEFYRMDAENITLSGKFEYIILSDTIGYFEDIQKAFKELKKVSTSETRIIITYHNFLWNPFLKLAEMLGLKMPQKRLNWLNREDIINLLYLEDFDVVKSGKRFLLPKRILGLAYLVNRCLAPLPLINRLCLTGYIIARPFAGETINNNLSSVSVIVPARNEKGNIKNAVERIPLLGNRTEVIFIEGGSSDGTLDEIKKVCSEYKGKLNLKYAVQEGRGKGDAVRKGFALTEGDILMILDADLTVPPEDLPKFYEAIAGGRGEFINGSRLVYPVEKEAMLTLNMAANKFFSLMFTWLLGQRLKDTLCGTKAISRKNYQKLIANRGYFGEFDPFGDFDLIFGAAKLNLKIVEVPIKYRARQYGETNISRFRHGWLLLKMMFFAMSKIKFI